MSTWSPLLTPIPDGEAQPAIKFCPGFNGSDDVSVGNVQPLALSTQPFHLASPVVVSGVVLG